MLTHPNFPTELSEAEEDAGFSLIEVENPFNGLSDAAYQFYSVVACQISNTDLVIKSRNPFNGAANYKHVRYGTLNSDEDFLPGPPEWQPVGNAVYDDPAQAVQEASLDLDDDDTIRINAVPYPRPPAR